jgi:hypothetical protein
VFLDEVSAHLAGLSEFFGKPISLQADSDLTLDQYDIVFCVPNTAVVIRQKENNQSTE